MRNPLRLTQCTACPRTGAACAVGLRLLATLARSVEAAGAAVGPTFLISGTLPVSGCAAPCHLGWVATADDCWLFGGLGAGDDPCALVGASGAAALARMQVAVAPVQ
jgi:hypothetical protein